MKVYITKYALTKGILKVDAEITSITGMVEYCDGGAFPVYAYGEGREWHLLEKSALDTAEWMRQKKLKSHTKAIDKLRKLTFKVKNK
jgi:hypothetical protein